jgi:Putative S-adenosyl-L-methionine-dependent methyltransferase
MTDATPPQPAPVDGTGDCACDEAVLEHEQRLSRSLLWALQRRYFEREGVEAWRSNTVPHYVTCNPALAHAYAAVVLGYLRDLRAASLDPAEPVTLLELGAGSGRFAHLFLRAFLRLHRASPLAGVRVRYVLTDFVAKNVDFLRAHDAFRPLVEEGLVDFAVLDAERDREIRLLGSGAVLGPGSLRNPPVVIANYVFDGIPHDVFAFRGGELHEGLVTVRGPGAPGDPLDPDRLARIQIDYAYRPAPLDYYGDPELDALLRDYAARFDGSTVLFPVASIRCLQHLAALAGGPFLLLSGDKGHLHDDALRGAEGPLMAIHGSFSFSVNYHALGAWARRRGGQALVASHHHEHLGVTALLLGEHPTQHAETRLAYAEAVERAGPDELFTLRRSAHEHYGSLGLPALVALIRLCHDDPRIVRDCLPALWDLVADAPEPARRDLAELVGRVWENYYHIGEARDLPFELATLLYALGEHAGSLGLFEASLRLYGDDPRTRWNMGLCHAGLGRSEEAARCFAEATAAGFVPLGALQGKPVPG